VGNTVIDLTVFTGNQRVCFDFSGFCFIMKVPLL
jgi:hypothetical protein